ncbi:hypothetical protein CW700_06040 [Candidatus Bathyarchaeota archaeon]|nr:MAG: hypothetical protein CW700_06040 [Candidatus Bathyarchaeota archaeon]
MVVAQVGLVLVIGYWEVTIYGGGIEFSDGYYILIFGLWILLPSFLISLGGYMGGRNRKWGILSVIASLPLLGRGLNPFAGAALGLAGGIILLRDWIQHGSWLAIIGGLMAVAHDGFLFVNSGGWKHMPYYFSYFHLIFWGLFLSALPMVLGGYIGLRYKEVGGWISVIASLPRLILSLLFNIPVSPLYDLSHIYFPYPDAGATLGIAGGIILLKQRTQKGFRLL